MKAIVYVDGFNLYYRALRSTPYRWLDLWSLSGHLLPRDEVVAIKYFTARIKTTPDDPNAGQRQDLYLRALATIPSLSIVEGNFLRTKIWMPLAQHRVRGLRRPLARLAAPLFGVWVPPPGRRTPTARVLRTEEKGSDVNLATHLLVDGFADAYDLAVVISNDSDLEEPIRYVRDVLKRPVGILNPAQRRNLRLALTTAMRNSPPVAT